MIIHELFWAFILNMIVQLIDDVVVIGCCGGRYYRYPSHDLVLCIEIFGSPRNL